MTEHAVEVAQPLELPAVVRRRLTSAELAGLAGLGAIALLPIPFGSFGFFVGQYALIYAILGLSVVVVTGPLPSWLLPQYPAYAFPERPRAQRRSGRRPGHLGRVRSVPDPPAREALRFCPRWY